jgi:hypothetical protein
MNRRYKYFLFVFPFIKGEEKKYMKSKNIFET